MSIHHEIVRAADTIRGLNPMPLNIVAFASLEVNIEDLEVSQALMNADLVLALGNVDLHRLAAALPSDQPALCVLADKDYNGHPPAPFKLLYADGVVFRGWRIAGLSGARSSGSGLADEGFTLTDAEADAAIDALPAADILLSHEPPTLITQADGLLAAPGGLGFVALDRYLAQHPPVYHIHAALADHTLYETVQTMIIGVCGVLAPPPLEFI
jgi:hypothetical protein